MGAEFAQLYDRMYAGRDYGFEVSIILPRLREPLTLLDVGCGTGEHARWFSPHLAGVLGIDTDASMIAIAKSKGIRHAVFVAGPIESLYAHSFGAAVCLFNVVNYIMGEMALAAFFRAVAKRLNPGAVFVVEAWNGAAVMNDPPRVKTTEFGILTPTLDRAARTVHMRFDASGHYGGFTHEYDHRLWTIAELAQALCRAGLENVLASPRLMPGAVATEKDWKIMLACEKVRT